MDEVHQIAEQITQSLQLNEEEQDDQEQDYSEQEGDNEVDAYEEYYGYDDEEQCDDSKGYCDDFDTRTCYFCEEQGHVARNCPERYPNEEVEGHGCSRYFKYQ
uniref:CCHC-type domain-containing protein n=1 Tax=Panagrolaimus sp. ES5 TaxID=591445 RepID=A0AC34G2M6_9BILA